MPAGGGGDVQDARPAAGQGARLVKQQGPGSAEVLQGAAVLQPTGPSGVQPKGRLTNGVCAMAACGLLLSVFAARR